MASIWKIHPLRSAHFRQAKQAGKRLRSITPPGGGWVLTLKWWNFLQLRGLKPRGWNTHLDTLWCWEVFLPWTDLVEFVHLDAGWNWSKNASMYMLPALKSFICNERLMPGWNDTRVLDVYLWLRLHYLTCKVIWTHSIQVFLRAFVSKRSCFFMQLVRCWRNICLIFRCFFISAMCLVHTGH